LVIRALSMWFHSSSGARVRRRARESMIRRGTKALRRTSSHTFVFAYQ
jgi:hypothetical protein